MNQPTEAEGKKLFALAVDLMCKSYGVSRQDRLEAAIIEALLWLDANAPGRAHDTLTEALKDLCEAKEGK